MKFLTTAPVFLGTILLVLTSCSTLEKSSQHGFHSNYYTQTSGKNKEKVYLDITEDNVTVFPIVEGALGKPTTTLSLQPVDSLSQIPLQFSKASLDIDITSILLKFRPATKELPAQLSTDLNVALYAGWRHDVYRLVGKKDPTGKKQNKVISRGYDFGILAGTGSTWIGASTTKTNTTQEYNGMILEFGLAGFLETTFASFGLATGLDYLLSSDRDVWIYNKKPWVGFVVGIALN